MAIMQKVQGSKKSKSSSSSSGGGNGNNSGSGGADPVSSSTKETVTKAGSGSTSTKKKTGPKTGHSRSYPRGVGLDFRKLAGLTLVSYIDHHGTFYVTFRFVLIKVIYLPFIFLNEKECMCVCEREREEP